MAHMPSLHIVGCQPYGVAGGVAQACMSLVSRLFHRYTGYLVIARGPGSRKPFSYRETPTLQTCPNSPTPHSTSYRRNMRGVSKLPALIARGFSSTSSAIRPAKGGLSGDGAVRTRRVPEGPGLAYFVESHPRKGGEQGSLPQGESQLPVCPCRCVVRVTPTEPE